MRKARGGGYVLRVLWIFALACLAWVFFRAQTLGDAVYVLTHMLEGVASPLQYLKTGFNSIGMDKWELAETVLLMLVPLTIYDYLGALKGREAGELIAARPAWQRWLFYAFIVLLVCFLSPKGMPAEFVYFQF